MVTVAVNENCSPQNRTTFRFLTSKFGEDEKEWMVERVTLIYSSQILLAYIFLESYTKYEYFIRKIYLRRVI